MSSSLELMVIDKIRDVGYVSAPMIKESADKSLQWINRILTAMADNQKLRLLGKIDKCNYYVLPRSERTLEDVKRDLTSREKFPTAWMGRNRTPQEYLVGLEPDNQKTAQKLFDPDHREYLDYFTQIIPAIETVCYGRRASSQTEIDIAWATIGRYSDRVNSLAKFLRMLVENNEVRSGAFAEALSNEAVNAFRSSYTREAS